MQLLTAISTEPIADRPNWFPTTRTARPCGGVAGAADMTVADMTVADMAVLGAVLLLPVFRGHGRHGIRGLEGHDVDRRHDRRLRQHF